MLLGGGVEGRSQSHSRVDRCGNLPEITLDPSVSESRATLHVHELLDADVMLDRGRIILRNNKKAGGDARVRVRFINQMENREEYFDLMLLAGAGVVVDRMCMMDREEPFYDNPKDKLRLGPMVTMRVFALTGGANVQFQKELLSINETGQSVVEYMPRQEYFGYPKGKVGAPPWLKGTPKQPKERHRTHQSN